MGLGIPAFFGIRAVVVAVRSNLAQPRARIIGFLAANVGCGLFLAAVGFLQPNPEPHLVLLGVAPIAATLLVIIALRSDFASIKRFAPLAAALGMAYCSTYALPPTLPVAAGPHLEGALTVPPNTNGWKNLTGPDGGDRLQGLLALTRTFTVNPGSYRVDLACPGYFDQSVSKIVQVGIGASWADARGRHPLSVEAGWSASFAYSCNGTFGSTGNREVIRLTANNVVTGTDLPTQAFDGVVGVSGFLGLPLSNPAPAGRYIIRVTLPYPDDNQCQWHLIVHGAR